MSVPKNGDGGMNYNTDVNGVIKDVFDMDKDRNNLAVQIENGSQYEFAVKFRVDHGALSSTKGDVTLHAVAEGGLVPSSYTVGVKAKGVGSNIVFVFEFAKTANLKPIHLMAATPSNKSNYTKCNTDAASKDLGKGFSDSRKHYANDGPTYLSLHTVGSSADLGSAHAEMMITAASPAVCMFRIKPGPKP